MSLIVLAILLLTIHTINNTKETQKRIHQVQEEYISDQRRLIKAEVDQVVKVIDYEMDSLLQNSKVEVKSRVLEAHAIAENIYHQNISFRPRSEIEKLIIDALRPIRFDQGKGYYFINGLDGVPRLIADTPEREGISLLDRTDTEGRYVVRDMINIINTSREGFYTYLWTKPGSTGENYQKVSYIKEFQPFDWYIGAGAYLDTIESSMQNIILHYIDTHRFGPNHRGYVFINELLNINGGNKFARVYANPNRPNDTGKFISDDFKDAKGKMFRREFLKGIREKGECYVDYWYRKIDNPQPSPKTSYFKLAGKGRFIVAAGVYLDDVEQQITVIQKDLKAQLRQSYLIIISFFILIILGFILFFNYLGKKLANDYQLFVDFFKDAAHSSKAIEKEKIRFIELDQLADYANQMVNGKKEIEDELRNERERLLITLHSIVDGVIVTDTESTIVIMNRVAEKLTGWKEEEASGRKLSLVYQLSGDSTNEGNDATKTETGDQHLKLTNKYNETYSIVTNTTPILGHQNILLGNLIVFRDETAKIKTEEELLKAKKLESVGILADGIVHDFNNILAGLFGHLEMAKMKMHISENAYSHIEVAHQSLGRATQLTTQLLTFAKGGEPVLEKVHLASMIDDVVSFNLSGSNIKPDFTFPENLWLVKADQGQISQVITNLVINAKHAMPYGGKVYIQAENVPAKDSKIAADSVKVILRDEGIGMPHNIMEKIFDPYFSTKQKGSGLGLAMSHSIIQKHAGHIGVESSPGKGATFTLYLPADKREDHKTKSEREGESLLTIDKELNVLIVDDDETVRSVLKGMLELSGYSVDCGNDGDEGIKMYGSAIKNGMPYDLVLMDLTIPGGKGGKDAVQEILQQDSNAKVIAISGYSNDPIMAHYNEYGFSGRITKPFAYSQLNHDIARIDFAGHP